MGAAKSNFQLSVHKHVLANGLTVLLYEDHRLPQAAVNLWYHVGSKDESPGRTGFAHLFEHMMFQGSEHYPDDFFKPLEEVGARLNGSTAEDRTNYWEVVPKAYLERALWLESDRMGWLLPAMDQAKLDNQREVVKNERRQTMDNQPYGLAEEALLEALYPLGHPYRHSIIGSMEDLDRASLEDVKEFFRRFYTPNNASLCVAGDIEPASALALVEKYFGSISHGPVVSPMRPDVPVLSRPERLLLQDSVNLPRLHLEWPTPPQLTDDDAALSVLAYVLATGKDSRLVRRLQVDAPLAQSLWSYQGSGEVASNFLVVATAQPGRALDEMEEAVWDEVGRLQRDGVEGSEVTAAIDAIKAGLVRRLQSVGGFGGVSDMLNRYQTFTGAPGYLPTDLARYEALTPEAVQAAAVRFLSRDRHVMVGVVPRSPSAAEAPRTALPGPGEEGSFALPAVARETLPSGVALWVCPQAGLPLVTVSLVLASGAADDPADRPGLARMTADMMDESAAGMGPVELARRQKTLATSLATSVNHDQTAFTLSLLREHFEGGMGLLADVVRRPDFRHEDLERLRKDAVSDLHRSLDDVSQVGEWVLKARLYGEASPYGHPLEGTLASLAGMTKEDVKRFYERVAFPARALLLVVGDVTVEEARRAALDAFGDWKADDARAAGKAPEARAAEGGLFLVDKPGAPQSFLAAAEPALARTDPRYPAFLVFNSVLGGQFTSRINLNLREDKGYTYGARSYGDLRLGVMPWVFSTSVQTDKTAESILEARGEMNRILSSSPVTEEEFEKARTGMVLRYPQNFETQGQLVQSLASLWLFGLPHDYHERMLARLRGLTLEEVNRAGKEILAPDRLVWVAVGDRAAVEESLGRLGLGTPVVVAPPGRP